ncbi:MAG: HAD family hydrolase [Candidatus Omnitrophota bacterium]|nr:MAG: HAD family hydrolase [Candidatus Omnitrophota bacterium]
MPAAKEKTIRAVFLDRDGVINEYPGDYDYVKSRQEFRFLPGVFDALGLFCANGFKIFIISNQAGVSKGLYSQEDLDLITRNMLDALSNRGIVIAGVYYCTHSPEENCGCRKPKAGMIDAALEDLRRQGLAVDMKASYCIGDSLRDIELGKNKGLRTILLFSGKEKPENMAQWGSAPDCTFPDLLKAARSITEK